MSGNTPFHHFLECDSCDIEGSMYFQEAAASIVCPHSPDGKCSNCKNVLAMLGVLDRNVVPCVKENARIVDDFMARLETVLKDHKKDDVVIIDKVHGGSAFEHLAVENKADFDITLILGKPFVSTNFQVGRDPSNYFTLKWNTHSREKRFADHNDYLIASELKKYVFDILQNALSKVQLTHGTFSWKAWASSINVNINLNTGNKISIDLVPQIAFRTWGECPDLKPLNKMPESLRHYISKLEFNRSPVMFFALGIPKPENYENPDKLFNISFSLLEKKFLRDNTEIRALVRLVKVVAKRWDWERKFSFKSFHIKRVALKYWDELAGKVLWEGCQELLRCISREIDGGTIDGYFVKDQVMKKWQPGEILSFQREIERVLILEATDFL